MAGNKKPRKKYANRGWSANNVRLRAEPWKIDAVFSPMEKILDTMERTGETDCTLQGQPCFFNDADNEWYEAAPALEGIIDAFEVLGLRRCVEYSLEPLRQLARRWTNDMVSTAADLAACRASLQELRRASMSLTAGEAKDIVTGTRVRIELDKKQAAAEREAKAVAANESGGGLPHAA